MLQQKLSIALRIILLIGITILFINDFFPTLFLNKILPNPLIAIVMVVALVLLYLLPISREIKSEKDDLRGSIKFQVFIMLYTVGLIILLNLFGGSSEVNIVLTNPIVLIVLLISIIQIIKLYIKLKNYDHDSPSL